MRRVLFLVGLTALFVLAAAVPRAMAQTGFDRPGGDYTHFVVKSGDPAECSARCDKEGRCRAWAFSYPVTGAGAEAQCWLKTRVPRRTEGACCVSGVKGSGLIEPRAGAIEFGMDRFGGDYRNFDTTPQAKGESCATACSADNRCRAWTYVRPGYQGSAAHCYLKSRVTPPRRKPCCMSGVVR